MKKLIALGLVIFCVLAFVACSGSKEKVWSWTQSLTQENVSAETWYQSESTGESVYEPLTDTQTLELVALLNSLTKRSFTENKQLVGITPIAGIRLTVEAETYHINYSPSPYGKYGMLEIGYDGKQWWIDNDALLDFCVGVTENTPLG